MPARPGLFDKPEEGPGSRTLDFMMRFNTARLLLVLVMSALGCMPSRALAAPAVELTREEQAWLAEHPEIVLGTTTEYQPLVIQRADGTHFGMLVDIFEQVNRVLNARIRLHIEDPWAVVQEKAQNREIDGLAMGARDPSRDIVYNATDVLVPTYFSVFARSRREYRLKRFSDLKGMRIGYKRAARPTRSLLEKLPSAVLEPYDDHESMTKALLSREIDVIVAWMSYDHWRKEKLQGTIDNILLIEEYPIEMVTYIRKDWPELIPILNKTLAALQQDELPRIINKWFGQWPRAHADTRTPLTSEERVWLGKKHTVRVRVTDWPPYMIVHDNKPPQGIAIEHLELIKERTGINFRYEVTDQPFAEFLESRKQGQGPDMTAVIVRTPEREPYLSFSAPYFSSPYAIFVREKDELILGISALAGKTLAVPRGHVLHGQLARNYPDIRLLLFGSDVEALQAVATGQADAYIGSLTVASHIVNRQGFSNLQVTAASPFGEQSFSIGNRIDWPELTSIIDKTLASITEEEKTTILGKYLAIRYEQETDKSAVLKWVLIVIAAASGVVMVLVVWNKQLSSKVKERTSQLSESEARFRSTFEQVAVGVAHVSLEGQFLRINRKFCHIVGYSQDEMRAMSFQDISHPDDIEADLEHVRQLLDGERENYSMDKRYLRRDGAVAWVNLTVSLLFDKGGNPEYFVSVVKDISDRKQAEEALQESEKERGTLREELIHATRRMAMGELTTAIAHELNQPLAAIMTNAQAAKRFLEGGTPALDDVKEILEDIVKDDRRAGDIIGKLRGLLKREKLECAAIHVNEMMQEVIALIRSDMLVRRVSLETMFAENIPPLSGDKIQLQQVCLNLILNAAEALEAVERDTRKITLTTQYRGNEEVWISVSDTGRGLGEAVIEHLFNPFYTTKKEGMGVGLSISSTIVKLHGGRIQVESSRGGGATFHVALPAQERRSECRD